MIDWREALEKEVAEDEVLLDSKDPIPYSKALSLIRKGFKVPMKFVMQPDDDEIDFSDIPDLDDDAMDRWAWRANQKTDRLVMVMLVADDALAGALLMSETREVYHHIFLSTPELESRGMTWAMTNVAGSFSRKILLVNPEDPADIAAQLDQELARLEIGPTDRFVVNLGGGSPLAVLALADYFRDRPARLVQVDPAGPSWRELRPEPSPPRPIATRLTPRQLLDCQRVDIPGYPDRTKFADSEPGPLSEDMGREEFSRWAACSARRCLLLWRAMAIWDFPIVRDGEQGRVDMAFSHSNTLHLACCLPRAEGPEALTRALDAALDHFADLRQRFVGQLWTLAPERELTEAHRVRARAAGLRLLALEQLAELEKHLPAPDMPEGVKI